MSNSSWPEIRHSYENHTLAPSRWQAIEMRPDDIVISTSYKAGTTWMQNIVGNIIFHETGLAVGEVQQRSPWVDMRVMPEDQVREQLEAQTHQRFIKTHLPLDGLPYDERVKYIMVGRDPRDVFMSLLNHFGNFTDDFYDAVNNHPTRVGDPLPRMKEDLHEVWRDWMTKSWFDWETDGYPQGSHLSHCLTWWEFRHLPNIELFHYADMLEDLEREMHRVATFLEINVSDAHWPKLVDNCTFASMKKSAIALEDPSKPGFIKGGAKTFFNKGTNGRWRDVLTEAELEQYRAVMAQRLPLDCADWLENGLQGG